MIVYLRVILILLRLDSIRTNECNLVTPSEVSMKLAQVGGPLTCANSQPPILTYPRSRSFGR